MISVSVIQEGNDFHYVSGTRYSLDYIKATTFCSKEIEIDSKDDYIKIPKNLLDDTEICKDCLFRVKLIDDSRFPSICDYDGSYRFIIHAGLKIGSKAGTVKTRVIPADDIEQAKKRFEHIFKNTEDIIYYRISKEIDNLDTEILYTKSRQNNETE
jgi:hypothetical protein